MTHVGRCSWQNAVLRWQLKAAFFSSECRPKTLGRNTFLYPKMPLYFPWLAGGKILRPCELVIAHGSAKKMHTPGLIIN